MYTYKYHWTLIGVIIYLGECKYTKFVEFDHFGKKIPIFYSSVNKRGNHIITETEVDYYYVCMRYSMLKVLELVESILCTCVVSNQLDDWNKVQGSKLVRTIPKWISNCTFFFGKAPNSFHKQVNCPISHEYFTNEVINFVIWYWTYIKAAFLLLTNHKWQNN